MVGPDPVAQAEDAALASVEMVEQGAGEGRAVGAFRRVRRVRCRLVLQAVRQGESAVVFRRGVERDAGLRQPTQVRQVAGRPTQFQGDLGLGGLASELLRQLGLRAPGRGQLLVEVARQVHRAMALAHLRHDLAVDVPRREGAETDAALGVELLGRGHQAQVARADQVQQVIAAPGETLGEVDDQAQVAFDELIVGEPRRRRERAVGPATGAQGATQRGLLGGFELIAVAGAAEVVAEAVELGGLLGEGLGRERGELGQGRGIGGGLLVREAVEGRGVEGAGRQAEILEELGLDHVERGGVVSNKK